MNRSLEPSVNYCPYKAFPINNVEIIFIYKENILLEQNIVLFQEHTVIIADLGRRWCLISLSSSGRKFDYAQKKYVAKTNGLTQRRKTLYDMFVMNSVLMFVYRTFDIRTSSTKLTSFL